MSALGHELRRGRPSIAVLEDLHWADEATLDVARILTRRIESFPALVLGTYRDDELDRAHSLRIALGELPSRAIERVALAPLSLNAAAALSAPTGVDHRELHRSTGGNPFLSRRCSRWSRAASFPTASATPCWARAARLDPSARALLDAVAVVPERAEIWLLEVMARESLTSLEECLASGVLRAERDAVGFRHERAEGVGGRGLQLGREPRRGGRGRRTCRKRALGNGDGTSGAVRTCPPATSRTRRRLET